MAALFAGSIIFVYLFSCITIINYGSFSNEQKLSLIYLTNIGMTYTGIIGAKYSLILLIIMVYLYEEFFQTYDSKKNLIITKFSYKVIDFMHNSIFKDYMLWMAMALFVESYTVQLFLGEWGRVAHIISFALFLVCIHKLYAQTYHIEPITQMFEIFNKNAYEQLELSDPKVKTILELVATIEDKSFFIRENTYNWCSLEFIKYRLARIKAKENSMNKRRVKRNWKKYFRHPFMTLKKGFHKLKEIPRYFVMTGKRFLKKVRSAVRGYSTLEMQYIRTIGITAGRDKYVLRRKIFEIIYTRLFFEGVKNYYVRHGYMKARVFKEYLLYQYLQVAYTQINKVPFQSFMQAFKTNRVSKWNINSVTVAVLGMNGNGIYPKRLNLYRDIFNEFNVDANEVLRLANDIQMRKIKKLP